MLNNGPPHDTGAFGHDPGPAGPKVPRVLPPIPDPFVGRDDDLRQLTQNLTLVPEGVTARTMISGPGSSALAIYWAHTVGNDLHPGGTVYVDLRRLGSNVPTTPISILTDCLHNCGLDHDSILRDVNQRRQQWEILTRKNRVLLILDHVSSQDDITMVIPSPGSTLIATAESNDPPGPDVMHHPDR